MSGRKDGLDGEEQQDTEGCYQQSRIAQSVGRGVGNRAAEIIADDAENEFKTDGSRIEMSDWIAVTEGLAGQHSEQHQDGTKSDGRDAEGEAPVDEYADGKREIEEHFVV